MQMAMALQYTQNHPVNLWNLRIAGIATLWRIYLFIVGNPSKMSAHESNSPIDKHAKKKNKTVGEEPN
ncbi:hypothetical protein M5D96_013787 [Drosophila gunungcola]|uniref:Uncharacterized protein n=1 Tax=Drosophila gunungcola TaxID=103775 RepID=A0A9P9YBF7_9MUSC|nr:hypothetical protein M5D96_013787 [Drosophila gunungcola]